jgi:uncharacterized protein YabE (DUF348 family)
MHKRVRRKKVKKMFYGGMGVFFVGIFLLYFFVRDAHDFVASATIERITIIDDGRMIDVFNVPTQTVGEFLETQGRSIAENDRVLPLRESQIFGDDVITIEREKKVTVSVDEQEIDLYTYRDSLENILSRGNIVSTKDDIVKPHKKTIVQTDVDVEIIRVEYREEIETEKIVYKTIQKEDDELSFRKKVVEQAGENGKKELTYQVAYHDGEEVDRELINTEITKEPQDEIIVQGTYVKLGKKHTGACSWYAHTGTMAAANPWLPMGSYVKVTNVDNGKSVIVRINDRGPFVPGRIIDLDKVAFAEIASIGAGVINVKMEEIVN